MIVLDKKTSWVASLITIVLFIITLVITIWLFNYLIEPEMRSNTFNLTISFVCFLELLSFGYVFLSFVPNLAMRITLPLYQAIGVILGIYIAVSVASMIFYNMFSAFFGSPKAYLATLVLEFLAFLVILSSVVILNVFKSAEENALRQKRQELVQIIVDIEKIHLKFLNYEEMIDAENFRSIQFIMKRLEEMLQVSTPYQRQGDIESDNAKNIYEIETKIRETIVLLDQFVSEIPSVKGEELNKVLSNIKHLATTTLQMLERREKLLVK